MMIRGEMIRGDKAMSYSDACRRQLPPSVISHRLEKMRIKLLASEDSEDIDGRFSGVTIDDIILSHPEVKWAQRVDKVYLTVVLPLDAKDAEVDLKPDGVFTFSANGNTPPGSCLSRTDIFKVGLFDKVNVEESKTYQINTGGRRSILCVIEKAEKKWWKRLLCDHVKPPHYLKVDWEKWVDEEDSSGAPDLDTGGMEHEERMTLKHKNMSKWATWAMKRGLDVQDEGTRTAISEQLHQHALLTRKMNSMKDNSSSESSDGSTGAPDLGTGGMEHY